MNMHFGFSWVGLIVFLLPMIINVFYVIFPPKSNGSEGDIQNKKFPILESLEHGTRIAYTVVLCNLISNKSFNYTNPLLNISIVFLILYYIVWIRYFIGGRDTKLLRTTSREIYHKGSGMIFKGNPNRYIIEIALPIE